MLKLYGVPIGRASVVRWYLEELGFPYEFIILDLDKGEHLQPEFLSINPTGKLPVIVDEDFTIFESGAMLLYLAEKYQKFAADVRERGAVYQWVLFASSTLIDGLKNETQREQLMPRLLQPLENILRTQPYLVGESITVADIAVGSTLSDLGFAAQMLKLQLDLSPYPALVDYIQRLSSRPAFKKAMPSEG